MPRSHTIQIPLSPPRLRASAVTLTSPVSRAIKFPNEAKPKPQSAPNHANAPQRAPSPQNCKSKPPAMLTQSRIPLHPAIP